MFLSHPLCTDSAANAIPTGLLHTGVGDCGHFEQSFSTIRFGRALWFCGKYAIVSFEIFIVGSSLWALRYGARTVSNGAEVAMHATCTAVGTAAFVTFYVLSGDAMDAHGFNAATQAEATSDAYVVPYHACTSRRSLLGSDQNIRTSEPELQQQTEKVVGLRLQMVTLSVNEPHRCFLARSRNNRHQYTSIN